MKKFIGFIMIITFISCNQNTEYKNIKEEKVDIKTLLIKNLTKKFGEPIKTMKESKFYDVYEWLSFDTEFGRSMKNEIDKTLNILPQKENTEFDKSTIIDTYSWETPQVLVILIHSFDEVDGKIKSYIKLKINLK
ncbi:MAG: hypothetical protein WCP69_15110 [Bacteroidota bacterium]